MAKNIDKFYEVFSDLVTSEVIDCIQQSRTVKDSIADNVEECLDDVDFPQIFRDNISIEDEVDEFLEDKVLEIIDSNKKQVFHIILKAFTEELTNVISKSMDFDTLNKKISKLENENKKLKEIIASENSVVNIFGNN